MHLRPSLVSPHTQVNNHGQTALMVAAFAGHAHCVAWLLAHQVRTDGEGHGCDSAQRAHILQGHDAHTYCCSQSTHQCNHPTTHPACLRPCPQADPAARCRVASATACHYAAAAGQDRALLALARHPAHRALPYRLVDLPAADGFTALHYAAWHDRPHVGV